MLPDRTVRSSVGVVVRRERRGVGGETQVSPERFRVKTGAARGKVRFRVEELSEHPRCRPGGGEGGETVRSTDLPTYDDLRREGVSKGEGSVRCLRSRRSGRGAQVVTGESGSW